MPVDIEPLLARLTELAPNFGRASGDIEAMVSRGRAGDYKGVLQNARLVLEALLRSIVVEDLKQTPGKAMLDELIQKFRQQANVGHVPTNMLAHMGTVQAWGNLSSHDHAGTLSDAAVHLGDEELVASLNSMVAILKWYAEKKGHAPAGALEGTFVREKTPAGVAAAPVVPPAPSAATPVVGASVPGGKDKPRSFGFVMVILVGIALVGVGGVALQLRARGKVDRRPEDGAFASLNAVYRAWKEPLPPASCRDEAQAAALSKASTDVGALGLIEAPSPEAAYLLARAVFTQKARRSPTLELATACAGFTNAHNLAAKLALVERKPEEAEAHFQAAIAADPKFLEPRLGYAGLLAQRADELKDDNLLDKAVGELGAIIAADPDYGSAYFLRGGIALARGDKPAATTDFCKAGKLGVAQGKKACDSLQSSAP